MTASTLERWAIGAVVLYTVVLLAVTVKLHPTPLYFVETDLVGEYIPAARDLAAGHLADGHYSYKGPGYPLLLAAAVGPCRGDYFLAARLLSVLASGCAAWLAFLIARSFAGPAISLFVLGGMLFNPTFIRYAIEAGTDAPTLAVALAATWWALRTGSSRWLFLSGLAAGYATLMRYNAAFLVPAAAFVLLGRREPLRRLASYAAGVGLPLAAWLALDPSAIGHALHNNNYLNVAYELYGRDMPWDLFEAQIGSRFHSLGDVIAFDPIGAVARTAWNLGDHLVADLHELVPLWIGVIAAPGLILWLRRRDSWQAGIHAGLCALALAPVFYSSRFSLYLLPFYLAGAGALLSELPRMLGGWIPKVIAAGAAPPRSWFPALAAALLLPSAWFGFQQLEKNLADAPHEARLAGERLAAAGLSGDRIMARKPHVAYFAGMQQVPFPPSGSLIDLISRARASGTHHLFYSPIEQILRPEYAVLSDSGVSLPGLEQVTYWSSGRGHFYAVYRITDTPLDSLAMDAALERTVLRYVQRRPGSPEAQVFAAAELVSMKHHREALDRLLALERAGVLDPAVATLASTAYFELGDYEHSYRECELAMRLQRPTGWSFARLATARQKQHRYGEARDLYRRAAEMEPGNPEHLENLGLACVALRDYPGAAAAFERCVRLAPGDAQARRYAMGAYQLAGNPRRAAQILAEAARWGIPVQEMLDPEKRPAKD